MFLFLESDIKRNHLKFLPQAPHDRGQALSIFIPFTSTLVPQRLVCPNWGHDGSLSKHVKTRYSKIVKVRYIFLGIYDEQ